MLNSIKFGGMLGITIILSDCNLAVEKYTAKPPDFPAIRYVGLPAMFSPCVYILCIVGLY